MSSLLINKCNFSVYIMLLASLASLNILYLNTTHLNILYLNIPYLNILYLNMLYLNTLYSKLCVLTPLRSLWGCVHRGASSQQLTCEVFLVWITPAQCFKKYNEHSYFVWSSNDNVTLGVKIAKIRAQTEKNTLACWNWLSVHLSN